MLTTAPAPANVETDDTPDIGDSELPLTGNFVQIAMQKQEIIITF